MITYRFVDCGKASLMVRSYGAVESEHHQVAALNPWRRNRLELPILSLR